MKDWEVKKLCEICQINPSKAEARKKLSATDLVSFIPMSNLGIQSKAIPLSENKLLSEVVGSYTYFANNDVLLAKITPCFENGKIGIARDLTNGIGFGSSEYIVFRSIGIIEPEYLFYFLSQDSFRNSGARLMTGAVGHKRVAKDFIENHPILVPPLSEQKRIVSIVDEAFEAINIAIDNTKQNLTNARELFDSYLNAIFTQKGDGWVNQVIEDHVKFIDYRGRTPNKTEKGMRLITAKNVKMGFLQTEPQEFVDPDIYDTWMTRGIPRKYDVLFTTEAPMGNVAQLDTDEKVAFAQRIIIMQPHPKFIDSTFLKFLLLSNVVQNRIKDKGTGATVQGIKASLLKKIVISYPSEIINQKDIVLKLDALRTETQRLEAIYCQKLAALIDGQKFFKTRYVYGQ